MSIRIEKTGGPWPANRYGIILKHLPRFLRKFLITHRNLAKWSDDDQFMECVLKIQRPNSTTSTIDSIATATGRSSRNTSHPPLHTHAHKHATYTQTLTLADAYHLHMHI